MTESRTVFDPFLGVTATISSRLVDRLRGKYACGPTLPNGEPEFGWRLHDTPPIQHEAAARIEELEASLAAAPDMFEALRRWVDLAEDAIREIGIEPNPDERTCLDLARAALAKARPTPDQQSGGGNG